MAQVPWPDPLRPHGAFVHKGPVLLPRQGCAPGHWLTPVFSPLSSPSPGSLVQAALTQEPSSVSAAIGEKVQITCSGGSSYYGWYQQKVPGSAPVTVIHNNNQRPSDIPSQFSSSTSGTTGTLTINGVQAKVEAVYYCGSWDSSTGSHGDIDDGAMVLVKPWLGSFSLLVST
uniref:Ig-like domain-containing protein n=1 Tax=Strigops habroptila TaxID=2489341 RepID=A0A672UR25_STRHB